MLLLQKPNVCVCVIRGQRRNAMSHKSRQRKYYEFVKPELNLNKPLYKSVQHLCVTHTHTLMRIYFFNIYSFTPEILVVKIVINQENEV